jgi:hypothetical protein
MMFPLMCLAESQAVFVGNHQRGAMSLIWVKSGVINGIAQFAFTPSA